MIKADIVKILDKYPVIALAVSGGSDSMAMCEWFRQNRDKDSFVVLNIDHHIRGEESTRDSRFVEKYAMRHGLRYLHYDVYAIEYAEEYGYTLEQAARLLRRDIYRKVCQEVANVVATAHHASDQIESVLLHILRGSGINGLVGMSVEDGYLLRPLLHTSKNEILEYIKRYDIEYCEDSTNQDTAYSRNWLRHEIIPRIEEKYDIGKSLKRLSERAREIEDYIDSQVPVIERDGDAIICDIRGQHRVIASEILHRAFGLLGVEADIEERHISLLIELCERENGTTLDMPYGIKAYSEYGRVALALERERADYEYDFAEGIYDCDGLELAVERVAERGQDGLYIAVDGMDNVKIRPRRIGDVIEKFGGGTKSVGDYMTDNKVPLRLRDRLPIVIKDNNALCVAGVDISRSVKVTEESKQIYKISLLH